MKKKSRLSKRQQRLATEYLPLVRLLAKFFLQSRPHWQRSLYVDDLEGEGFLALSKASRTYDPARLPYPKAYFARAILNAMLKSIKKMTRMPGLNKISLAEAADLCPSHDSVDHIRLAIDDLPTDVQAIATDRFINGSTLRTLSRDHQIPLRVASRSAAALAKQIAESLDIALRQRVPKNEGRSRGSSRTSPADDRVSCARQSQND